MLNLIGGILQCETSILKTLMYAAVFTGLMTVLGWISITLPVLPAPITGQTLGVMLAGVILTPKQARPKHDNLHCPGRRRPSGISKRRSGE